jgi:uncharacterized coiled-coil protein SlyX
MAIDLENCISCRGTVTEEQTNVAKLRAKMDYVQRHFQEQWDII